MTYWLPCFSIAGCCGACGRSPSGERTGSRSTVREGACEADWAWNPAGVRAASGTDAAKKTVNAAPARSALLQWRIVARACMYGERRQPLWWIELHLHFTPLAVPVEVPGGVTDDILVPQFGGDLLGDVAHLADVVHAEHASAGLLAKLVEEQVAGAFLGRGGVWVEDAHGVDFHVGLAHLGADLALGIAG